MRFFENNPCSVPLELLRHVVARTFYQAEMVADGQAFVSGWVSASNIVGIAVAAFLTSFIDCTVYTNLGFLCGGGLLLYASLVVIASGMALADPKKEHPEEDTKEPSAPAALTTPRLSKQAHALSWLSWQFAKVCFLIFTMAIAREAQKFLIPVVGAQLNIHTSFVGSVAFMSQLVSLVAAPVGGLVMEYLGILPLVLASLLLSAAGIQVLCIPRTDLYVQGASLLGLACGVSAGAAIALSIMHAPRDKERSKSFMNGCRFFNSSADVVIPLVVGSLASSAGVLVTGSTLTLSMLGSICVALFSFDLQVPDVRVPCMDFVIPLKAVGPFTRTVLESIFTHYAPRQIYVVCQQEVRESMSQAMVESRRMRTPFAVTAF